jgi:hypothetical protein
VDNIYTSDLFSDGVFHLHPVSFHEAHTFLGEQELQTVLRIEADCLPHRQTGYKPVAQASAGVGALDQFPDSAMEQSLPGIGNGVAVPSARTGLINIDDAFFPEMVPPNRPAEIITRQLVHSAIVAAECRVRRRRTLLER